nr:shikimate dehydrogenase [Cytophagales bacterium]
MRQFGLIGFPLTHSFSKKYFSDKFEREGIEGCRYDLFELTRIEEFPMLLERSPELIGLNVTIPYKVQVMPFLNELDPACRAIGAVNCIRISKGKLRGYNTDYIGFKDSLEAWLGQIKPKALVLGTGGASRAVIQALLDLNIEHLQVSRAATNENGILTYKQLHDYKQVLDNYQLLINTTPVGMYPHVDELPPIPLDGLSSRHLLYDLIYNPQHTALMRAVESKGGKTKNGMEMLYLQAEAAWKIWNQGIF